MLDPFQRRVLALIATNRSPESICGGGSVINRSNPRQSRDLDIFHEAVASVRACAAQDIETLRKAGLTVDLTPGFAEGFIQVVVRGAGPNEFTRIDWALESAYRFFPAVDDSEFGWRLHDIDLAVNKILAMAGRQEPRDFVDLVHLHTNGYPIAALAWAAPAKDPGFTPFLILDEVSRNSRVDPNRFQAEVAGAESIDLVELKRMLLDAIREARALFETLPPEQMGRLYLDDQTRLAVPDPAGVAAGRLYLHAASLRGAWPTLSRPPAPHA